MYWVGGLKQFRQQRSKILPLLTMIMLGSNLDRNAGPKAIAGSENHKHLHSLSAAIMKVIGTTFRDYAVLNAWQVHAYGKKPNECWSDSMCQWEQLPKSVMVLVLRVLENDAVDAVVTFNDGSISSVTVQKILSVELGHNMKSALLAAPPSVSERRENCRRQS
jgi:hypothetical protein